MDRSSVSGSGEQPSFDDHEDLLAVVRGVGSVMFLTSVRILVARDGHERRPRTGIQSFPLEQVAGVRLEPGSGSSGRIVVLTGDGLEAASMFFEPRLRDRAEGLVALANTAVAGARTGSKGRPQRGRGHR